VKYLKGAMEFVLHGLPMPRIETPLCGLRLRELRKPPLSAELSRKRRKIGPRLRLM